MQIHKDINNLPTIHNAVITVGSFDGVHLGHRRIFEYVRQTAAQVQGETVVLTFHPHPQTILHPERPFFLLNSLEDNAQLIAQQGIDHLIILPFTHAFSQLSFQDFLNFLIKKINVRAIVMGPDHNFGHNREGNRQTMREICTKNTIEIVIIPELIMEDSRVRSSEIRHFIENEEFTQAEKLLGYAWKKNKDKFSN